jgi:hypothetical protein
MSFEIIYKGRDNTNDFILKADGVAVDLSGVTKMELVFSDSLTVSSDTSTEVFDWLGGDGKLLLSLGGIPAFEKGDKYEPELIVYDAQNDSGVSWGRFIVAVM